MNEFSEDRQTVRKYLLGTLDDPGELRRIEEKLMLDDDFAEHISIAEDELIEQYLDGDLSTQESEKFRQFFLAAPERKQKLTFIKNLKDYAAKSGLQPVSINNEKARQSFFGWFLTPEFLRFAVVILLFGVIGLIVWRTAIYESDLDKGLAQMRSAYRGTRPLESRSTFDFGYAPLTVTRGGKISPTDSKSLDRAKLLLLDAAENPSDARAHQALGIFYLNEKEFDKALEEFNTALEISPNDEKIISDLGALYLEKANQAASLEKDSETMENLARSLESLNRALQINENLPETLFNKALVLQKMRQPNQAREAWQKYLEKDSTSEWANEARKNLEDLQKQEKPPKDKSQILQDFLDAFRERDDTRAWQIAAQTKELITGVMIQQQLVNKFLEADQQSRKEEADEILSAFVYLGKLENQNSGDLFFSELANYYSNTNQSDRKILLDAQNGLNEAYRLILNNDCQTAIEKLFDVKNLFISAGNGFEIFIIDFQIAYCLKQLEKLTESNELLLANTEICEKRNYKWLQTIFNGWIGSNFSLLGEHSKAIDYNEKSLDEAVRTSNSYDQQKALNQLTHEYWLIGDSKKTLSCIFRYLNTDVSYFQSQRQQNRNLLFGTEGFYRLKFFETAAAFAQEEMLTALKNNDLSFNHTAHYHMALIYQKLGQYENVSREIDECFRLLDSIGNSKLKQTLLTKTRLVSANLHRESNDCQNSVDDYDRVIEAYGKTEFSINKYEARKGRLLCYIALKNDDAVRQEMPELIKIFDDNRQKISLEADRNVFFNNEQSVYDIAADYAFSQTGNSEQAFEYEENSRARSLLNLIENSPSQPLSLNEIRQRIPSGTQIIYYSVLPDKILIWQISPTKYLVAEKKINSAELSEIVENYSNQLQSKNDNEQLANKAKELYGILIQPVVSTLEADKSICIMADKMLFRVPFASLVSPTTNRFLIEDFALLYAPSATIFIKNTETAAQKTPLSAENLLSIGNPAFLRTQHKNFEDLPSAAIEAEKIASFYRPSKFLNNENAVKEQILDRLGEADVFHFAGHYAANADSPAKSKFLLAGSDLEIGEINSKNLSHIRLIVLSACETGLEKFYNGEGMIGAARTFLAADVPLVVASQWSVDSTATAELMIKFHSYRKQQNMPTIEALRQAQIEMLRNENTHFRQPYYWAGFLPIGGYADY